ncbi:MAG: chloride channel protein [Akkermansiaceae bacterium]|nr:chloride channel protein [Akkermansiaceae bacterium]
MNSPLPEPKPGWRMAVRWMLWLAPLVLLAGSASAFFLWSLDAVTRARFDHPWLLWCLPLAGWATAAIYQRWGGRGKGGNNTVLEAIHDEDETIPRRMAPLILFSTIATHLCGGSAGREGTAVQMGGSFSAWVARWFRVAPDRRRVLHMAGMAAGFGAVFGTPWAGALFAMEVPVAGRIQWRGWLPCGIAAWAGDWVCRAWGITHGPWPELTMAVGPWHKGGILPDLWMVAKIAFAAAIFGSMARIFTRALHGAGRGFARMLPAPGTRAFVGGLLVIALTSLLGTRAYLGLGTWSPDPSHPVIAGFFNDESTHPWAWFWKAIFTVVTLAAGFKGGEVTPLFFIGAGLGHALAGPFGVPVELFAACGLLAVFAAAARAPWACAVLGVELFGLPQAPAFVLVAVLAARVAGRTGLYSAQREAIAAKT